MKGLKYFYKSIFNGVSKHMFSRNFLFNSELFTSVPDYYKNIFSDSSIDYILDDSFLKENKLSISYSNQGRKIFLNDSKLEKKIYSRTFSPYEKIVLDSERIFLKNIGYNLIELKKIEPQKEFSYEFNDGDVSLLIK